MKMKFKIRRIVFLILIMIIVILLLSVVSTKLKNTFIGKNRELNLKFDNRIDDLNNFKYEDYSKVGWIQVQGTNIDYPVLDSKASVIEPSVLNYGWQSPYYFIGENREVILGHNILNVSNKPTVDMSKLSNFEGLMAFIYEDFAEENLYIKYTKDGKEEIYKIYSVGFYNYNSDTAESFSDKKLLEQYIEKVRKNSIYDYDIDVNSNDKLITVKTCTRYFGLYRNQEMWVDARKVRDNEKIVKYKVVKNDNYKILSLNSDGENG